MQFFQLLLAITIVVSYGCNPLMEFKSINVRGFHPAVLPAHFISKIDLQLRGGIPQRAGLTFSAADGRQVATSECETASRQVTCTVPPLDVGTYTLRFSPDRSCGPSSYRQLDDTIDVIEPAHVAMLVPSHGPAKAPTDVRLAGSNIGGAHVSCHFLFTAAPGAKYGCSMSESSSGATEVTATTAVCHVPAWPGPIQQHDANHSFHPLPGANCSREVKVQLTNDGLVLSQEPVIFRYDDEVALQFWPPHHHPSTPPKPLPQIVAIEPAHGELKAQTEVTVTGNNFIGDPRVYCELTFPPGPGTKLGCDMPNSFMPATGVTETSAVCRVPEWPGPMKKVDLKNDTIYPLPGAVCSFEVHIRITNNPIVGFSETVIFHYDTVEHVFI